MQAAIPPSPTERYVPPGAGGALTALLHWLCFMGDFGGVKALFSHLSGRCDVRGL